MYLTDLSPSPPIASLLLPGPFLVIYTESWIVDLYSAGPPGKADNTKVPHQFCPAPLPCLTPSSILTLSLSLSLQIQPLKIRSLSVCVGSVFVRWIHKRPLRDTCGRPRFISGDKDPLWLLSGRARIHVNDAPEITGLVGERDQLWGYFLCSLSQSLSFTVSSDKSSLPWI